MKYILLFTILWFTCFPSKGESPSYTPKIKFAKDINPNDLNKLDPRLLKVVNFIADYCEQNKITFVITSMIRTKEKNIAVKSVSTTHVEARAVDFSIRKELGWNEINTKILFDEVEMRYNFIGAVSFQGKRRTILVMHDANNGTLYHAHIQVDRSNPYKGIKK